MAVLRRLTALVTMCVTLVLVLAESGFACSRDEMAAMAGMAGTGVGASAAGDEMAGMAMPSAPPASTNAAAARPGPAHDRASHPVPRQAPRHVPCRFPWAPGGCRDMAPCAPAALTMAALMPTPPAPVPDAVVASRVTALPSVERAPEPPPPRA